MGEQIQKAEGKIDEFKGKIGPKVEGLISQISPISPKTKISNADRAIEKFMGTAGGSIEDIRKNYTVERISSTATSEDIEKAKKLFENLLAEKKEVHKRTIESLEMIAKIQEDPVGASQQALLSIAEYTNDPNKRKIIERTNKHLEGKEADMLPIGFIDAVGSAHILPLFYVHIKRTVESKMPKDQISKYEIETGSSMTVTQEKIPDFYRVVDPQTGAKFEAETLEKAMAKYAKDGIAADGILRYKIGEKVYTEEIKVSKTLEGKIDTFMCFAGTTSMAALLAPDPTITKAYAAIAGGASMAWFAYRGGKRIYKHIEHGTFDLRDPTIRLDLAMATACVFTKGKISTGIRIGGTALFITGMSEIAYNQVNGIVKDDSISEDEKRKRILQTAATFGAQAAFMIALRKLAKRKEKIRVKEQISMRMSKSSIKRLLENESPNVRKNARKMIFKPDDYSVGDMERVSFNASNQKIKQLLHTRATEKYNNMLRTNNIDPSKVPKLMTYKQGLRIIENHKQTLNNADSFLKDIFKDKPLYTSTRPKDVISLINKITEKRTSGRISYGLPEDLVGGRAVFEKFGDAQRAFEKLLKSKNYKIKEVIRYAEQSGGKKGYRAWHAVAIDLKTGQKVEFQIATKNQRVWADWLHDTIYKTSPGREIPPEVTTQAKEYSLKMSEWFYKNDIGQVAGPKPKCPRPVSKYFGEMNVNEWEIKHL